MIFRGGCTAACGDASQFALRQLVASVVDVLSKREETIFDRFCVYKNIFCAPHHTILFWALESFAYVPSIYQDCL